LDWKAKSVKVQLKTSYPEDGKVALIVKSGKKEKLTIKVRQPSWVKGDLKFSVNGKALIAIKNSNGYWEITKLWNNGDVINFEIPMSLRSEGMPDNPNRIALLYGPVVFSRTTWKRNA